jgi:hypothetical protein
MSALSERETQMKYSKIVTEIHRYDDPNAYSFSTLEQDSDGWVELFGTNYREAGVDAFYNDHNVEQKRESLRAEGFEFLYMPELASAHRSFVTHCQAPLEWQVDLDKHEADLVNRIVVWFLWEK